MKKISIFLACMAIFGILFANGNHCHQPGRTTFSDTTQPAKRDTVTVPVILVQKTDTGRLQVFLKKRNGNAKIVWAHVLVTGYKNSAGAWVQQPAIRYVDEKWRPFKRVIIPIL